MSAFIVSKDHIDAILTFAMSNKMSAPVSKSSNHLIVKEHLNTLGGILWRENHKSVNARYGERKRTPRYEFTYFTKRNLTLPVFVKLIHCLNYQSCEHRGWDKSLANQILISFLNQATRKIVGYDEAPWDL